MKVIIFILFSLLIVIISAISMKSQEDISFINSSHAENTNTKIFEMISIDLDSTKNDIIIFTNTTEISFEINSRKEFHIWNYKEYIDGKLIKFDVRPEVGDPDERRDYYDTISKINLDGNQHIVKISYESNNIEKLRDESYYPFDKYGVFSIDRNINENEYFISIINLPEADINPILSRELEIKTDNCDKFRIGQKLIKNDFSYITSGTGILDRNVTTLDLYIAEIISPEEIKRVLDCKLTDSAKENSEILLVRSLFPSKILFGFMLFLIVFFSLYYGRNINLTFFDKIANTYSAIIIPFILSVYTTSVIPPFRPLTFTLFDGLFLLPIVILAILEDLKNKKLAWLFYLWDYLLSQ